MIARAVVVIAALAVGANFAQARPATQTTMKPEAQLRFDEGSRLYAAGQMVEAAAAFEAGYAIDPRPEFQYSLGQVYRRMGDCVRALVAYQLFLDSSPPAQAAERAHANQARCRETMALRPGQLPVAPPPIAPRVLATTPAVTVQRIAVRDPWYRDWLGDALTGVGAIALVAGGVSWGLGARARDDANAASTLEDFIEQRDAAARHRTIAIVGVSAGAALITAGMVRYVLRPTRIREVAVSVDATGAVAIGGTF